MQPATLNLPPTRGSTGRAAFFAILVFEMVFLMAARTPVDSDLWWHLATGEQTLRSGWPVLADTFSYTRAGALWTNHSWLGEVILALAYRAGGWMGVSTLGALLAAGRMLLVYRQMAGHPLWRAFLVVMASLVAAPVWSARPQVFSLFLLALLMDVVRRYWSGDKTRLYWLPLIFALWSNLHGGYALGFIFLGCWMAGALLDRLLRPGEAWRGRLLRLAVWTGLSLLAVLIHPNGLNMWRTPLPKGGVGALPQAIPEWASPDFHDPIQQPFLILLGGLVAALGLAGRPADGGGLISAAVFAAMALVARRNFGPFALVSLPVLAAAGWQVLERLRAAPGLLARLAPSRAGQGAPSPVRLQRALDATILAVLALSCGVKVYAAAQPATVSGYVAETFPLDAAAWVKANHPEGRLFNEYAWGGYLIWSLPEYPVFVDGRTDLFGDEIIGEWLGVMGAREGWQAALDRWKVRLVMIPPGTALERGLQNEHWTLLYRDPVAVVYGR